MAGTDAFDLSAQDWQELLASWGHKPYRARQLRSWLYQKGVANPNDMTELPQGLRAPLAEAISWGRLELVQRRFSQVDGSQKFLWSIDTAEHGKLLLESVLLAKGDRHTACLSSQVGCRVGCSFCQTGQMPIVWNLPSGAIVEQYWRMGRLAGVPIDNIVFMGMGEPLHNYRNVLDSAYRLGENPGFQLHPKRITISTAGVLPLMERFLRRGHPFGLALSLNAAHSEGRSQLIPLERLWPMASLIDFARRYYLQRHKRMTFEYVLIKGLNDGPRDGELLGRRLAHIPVKVNVIPYNPTSLGYEIPEDQALDAFVRSFLAQSRKGGKRAVITVRRSAGGDIDGACGQLAATRPLQKGLTRQ